MKKEPPKSLTLEEINQQLNHLTTGEGMINFLEDVLGRKLVKDPNAQKLLYKKLGDLCEERGWLQGAIDAWIHAGVPLTEALKVAGKKYEKEGFYAEAVECYKKAGRKEKANQLLKKKKN